MHVEFNKNLKITATIVKLSSQMLKLIKMEGDDELQRKN